MKRVYKLKELRTQLQQKLSTALSDEADTVATWLIEHYLVVSRTDILADKLAEISDATKQRLDSAVARLNQHEPIQYVLGEAYFYGRPFEVSPAVLIPRRETEELVAWVIEENPEKQLRVLDIGTGSGCIAVSLYLEMNQPMVYALDISGAVLEVAKANAARHRAKVTFSIDDIFQERIHSPAPFDIIVSNPPYVRQSEAEGMSARVIDYEPDQALFVGNKQPLRYYERMVELCRRKNYLKPGGKVYWEINEAMGDQLVNLLRENAFTEVRLRQDMQGKYRFIAGKLV